jgi:hypothetical protein
MQQEFEYELESVVGPETPGLNPETKRVRMTAPERDEHFQELRRSGWSIDGPDDRGVYVMTFMDATVTWTPVKDPA